MSKLYHVGVKVKNGDFEKALRKFKKKVNESAHLEELKERQEYVKPSVRKREVLKSAQREERKNLAYQRMFDQEPDDFFTKKRKKKKKK